MKVLLAEDDRDFGNILSQYVSINGYDVTLAIMRNPIFVFSMS